ncbi:hypothetical protein, partial [Staphylococcus microti]|uniref:hypothetical protein n=1 Tax=Staphylococcus microti TaxID=569857 RepID=UPI001C3F920A
ILYKGYLYTYYLYILYSRKKHGTLGTVQFKTIGRVSWGWFHKGWNLAVLNGTRYGTMLYQVTFKIGGTRGTESLKSIDNTDFNRMSIA